MNKYLNIFTLMFRQSYAFNTSEYCLNNLGLKAKKLRVLKLSENQVSLKKQRVSSSVSEICTISRKNFSCLQSIINSGFIFTLQ